MKNNGWVLLHRKLFENGLWTSEPFTKGQAWVDMFANANHQDGSFWVRGNEVKLKRGQIGWSELTMSRRWQWSKNKVRRFLKWLETEQQIEQQKTYITSVITIVNYDRYQSEEVKRNSRRNSERTADDTQTKNDNNDNNEKEEKERAAPTNKSMTVKDDLFENLENQDKVVAWLVGKGMEERFAKLELEKFISYWTERDSKGKMRYESQKFFEVRKRLATWFSRTNGNFNNKPPGGRTRKVIKL